jgi:hypothetical protein
MSDTEAVDQLNEEIWNLAIRGDEIGADAIVRIVAGSRAIATACELENAALWSVVLAYEELEDGIASFELRDEQVERLRSARAALIQHKAKS